jgi:hypothetical protein
MSAIPNNRRHVSGWECPCGREPPKRPAGATPIRTIVSLYEPWCPFCGRSYKPEFRLPAEADR